jgi:antitoxin FitA
MNKFVQIRNLTEFKHRKLKARAASKGMTITDYVQGLIDKDLDRPSNAELVERLKKLPPVPGNLRTVEYIREDRDQR